MPYLRWLRDIAREIQPQPSLEEETEHVRLLQSAPVTEEQFEEMFQLAKEAQRKFDAVERTMMADRQNPQKWVDYLVESRRYTCARIAAARRVLGGTMKGESHVRSTV